MYTSKLSQDNDNQYFLVEEPNGIYCGHTHVGGIYLLNLYLDINGERNDMEVAFIYDGVDYAYPSHVPYSMDYNNLLHVPDSNQQFYEFISTASRYANPSSVYLKWYPESDCLKHRIHHFAHIILCHSSCELYPSMPKPHVNPILSTYSSSYPTTTVPITTSANPITFQTTTVEPITSVTQIVTMTKNLPITAIPFTTTSSIISGNYCSNITLLNKTYNLYLNFNGDTFDYRIDNNGTKLFVGLDYNYNRQSSVITSIQTQKLVKWINMAFDTNSESDLGYFQRVNGNIIQYVGGLDVVFTFKYCNSPNSATLPSSTGEILTTVTIPTTTLPVTTTNVNSKPNVNPILSTYSSSYPTTTVPSTTSSNPITVQTTTVEPITTVTQIVTMTKNPPITTIPVTTTSPTISGNYCSNITLLNKTYNLYLNFNGDTFDYRIDNNGPKVFVGLHYNYNRQSSVITSIQTPKLVKWINMAFDTNSESDLGYFQIVNGNIIQYVGGLDVVLIFKYCDSHNTATFSSTTGEILTTVTIPTTNLPVTTTNVNSTIIHMSTTFPTTTDAVLTDSIHNLGVGPNGLYCGFTHVGFIYPLYLYLDINGDRDYMEVSLNYDGVNYAYSSNVYYTMDETNNHIHLPDSNHEFYQFLSIVSRYATPSSVNLEWNPESDCLKHNIHHFARMTLCHSSCHMYPPMTKPHVNPNMSTYPSSYSTSTVPVTTSANPTTVSSTSFEPVTTVTQIVTMTKNSQITTIPVTTTSSTISGNYCSNITLLNKTYNLYINFNGDTFDYRIDNNGPKLFVGLDYNYNRQSSVITSTQTPKLVKWINIAFDTNSESDLGYFQRVNENIIQYVGGLDVVFIFKQCD